MEWATKVIVPLSGFAEFVEIGFARKQHKTLTLPDAAV